MNRSVDGDVVGVELLAEEEWSISSNATILPEDEAVDNEEAQEGEVCCCCQLSDNSLFVKASYEEEGFTCKVIPWLFQYLF